MFRNKKGFTLIEMLIVVSIIGILASIVLVGLGAFRARGRDTRRIADLRQTQTALELFYTKNGAYPSATTWDQLRTAIIGAGIGVTSIPNDPNSPVKTYSYGTDGQQYVLRAVLEDSSHQALNDDADGTILSVDCGPAGFPENPPHYCVRL